MLMSPTQNGCRISIAEDTENNPRAIKSFRGDFSFELVRHGRFLDLRNEDAILPTMLPNFLYNKAKF
jgi:hypothetical protein